MEVPGAVCSALDSKVLVLNRVYAAIRVVDARRAFTLLVKQAAEVIALAVPGFAARHLVVFRPVARPRAPAGARADVP